MTTTFSALIAALVQGLRDLHNFPFFCLLTGQHYSFKTYSYTLLGLLCKEQEM